LGAIAGGLQIKEIIRRHEESPPARTPDAEGWAEATCWPALVYQGLKPRIWRTAQIHKYIQCGGGGGGGEWRSM